MIHPDTTDAVPVSNKFSLFTSYDRGIGSVNPYPAIIVDHHPAHISGIHQQKGQTVLPQIPPSSSPSPVIVMRQKRAPVNAPQKGLKTHPAHEKVKAFVAGMVSDIYLFLPVFFYPLKLLPCLDGGIIA